MAVTENAVLRVEPILSTEPLSALRSFDADFIADEMLFSPLIMTFACVGMGAPCFFCICIYDLNTGKTMFLRRSLKAICFILIALMVVTIPLYAVVDGWSLYEAAISDDNLDEVQSLIRNGMDVDVRDADGRTPLMYASSSDNPDLVRVLLEAGADATDRNHEGKQAIDYIDKSDPLYGTDTYWRLWDANF